MRVRVTRLEKALNASPSVVEAIHDRRTSLIPRLGGSNIAQQRIGSVFVQAQSASYGYMYQSQPAVRSVVDYIARNVAQLGLRLYERVSDDERDHAGDHPAAESLRNPNPQTPGQKFIFKLVADFLVYDNAYALKFQGPGERITSVNVPASAVGIVGQEHFVAEAYRIWRSDGTFFDVPAEAIIHWSGYDPEEPRAGFSKLETLRQELAADATARAAKTELDRAGLMPKGWIERPLEAPDWNTGDGATRFKEDWANQARGQNRHTPVLEEGMQFKQAGVSPEDAQLLESREFSKGEVAAIYGMEHCPPQDSDERLQFYADVLPPYCEMLCSYLDLQVLQQEYSLDDYYFEFNLDEKKMSDDRLKALTSAAGAPILLRNEARAMVNLPKAKGGDELVTPLNVIVGGKPSPQIMPVQDPNKPSQDGDHREDTQKALPQPIKKVLPPSWQKDIARQHRYVDEAEALMARYYDRQAASVKKAFEPDSQRWNRELGDDLHELVKAIVEREGGIYTARLLGDDFDLRQVQNYLKAMAEGAAEGINAATARDVAEIGVQAALDRARGERAPVAAASIGTRATVFARLEAAKQAPQRDRRMKVWIADTDRHADLHGAAVPLDGSWGGIEPGSLPNCKCSAAVV